MKTALFISEKPATLASAKNAYAKMGKSKLDYRIKYFVCLAGNVVQFKTDGKVKFSWDNVPYIPEKFINYPFDNMIADPKMDLYEPIKGKEKFLNNLKQTLFKNNDIDLIIIGTDSDREGANIWQSVWNTLPIKYQKMEHKRFMNNDMTPKGIANALENLLDDSYSYPDGTNIGNIFRAGVLRAQLDRCLGFSYTQALSLKTGQLVRAGRVKLPVLSIVAQREIERDNFVSKTYYIINVSFDKKYEGNLVDDENNQIKFDTKQEAEDFIKKLGSNGVITDLNTKRKSTPPPKLYDKSKLDSVISAGGHYSLEEIDAAMESLYHDKEILSYPRTEDRYLSDDQKEDLVDMLEVSKSIPELQPFIEQISQDKIDEIKNNKNYINSKKVGPHPALTVTNKKFDYSQLTPLEQDIMLNVCKSLVRIFLNDRVIDSTNVVTTIDQNKFLTHGNKIISPGWSALYKKNNNEQLLPDLKEGDKTLKEKAELKENKTVAPPLYTSSTLIDIMGHVSKLVDDPEAKKTLKDIKGIGTTATSTTIIAGLIESKLFTISKKKQYHATPEAVKLYNAIKNLPIVDPIVTAQIETLLNQVSKGKVKPKEAQKQILDEITKQCMNIKNSDIPILNKKNVITPPKKLDITYEGKEITLHDGKYGKYFSIETDGDPIRLSQKPNGHMITETELEKLLNGETLKDVKFHWSKKGTDGMADLSFDKTKNAYKYEFNNNNNYGEDMGVKVDNNVLYKRIGKNKKPYYCCGKIFLPSKWGSHTFTLNELSSLLKKETVQFDYKDKNGNKHHASLSLDKDGNISM